MRAHSAVVALILAIAFYFMLFWGYDALRILTSPTYGLDEVWRSQAVFGIGRFMGLTPDGLIKLAAAFGALKLTVAGVCAVHILDRARAMIAGTADPAVFEAGMMLVVAMTLVSVAPALWLQNTDLVREHLVTLLLAGLAAALLIIERSRFAAVAVEETVTTEPEADVLDLATVANKAWYSPWR